jgi:hypothetical protein
MLLSINALTLALITGCIQQVPGTAPAIATQPTSQTVAASHTATFSVVASGAAPITYQWQSNGTAISGATAASHTTPATIAVNNGTAYNVVVANTAGSVTSNTVLLAVTSTSCSAVPQAPTGLRQRRLRPLRLA